MTELKPSKLGTKEHWDGVYEEELANFHEIGDEGEIWFGEETIEKVVEWCLKYIPPDSDSRILEVGSGNGTLLFALLESGYPPHTLCGIDYSEDAIKLSQAIAANRGSEATDITFAICDFLSEDPPGKSDGWDLILDKGTYDAMSLGEKDNSGHAPNFRYPERVIPLLKPGGCFLITSCNFTEDELKVAFISDSLGSQTGLLYHSAIDHPTFTFGGKSGSIVSTVAFRKPR